MKQNSLPSLRQRGLSLSSLNVPRKYHLPLILLRTLSLIPAIIGGIHNIQSALNVPVRDSGGAITLQSTQIDFWIANLWCALAGYWSWILQTSMMRRWLYHYEISNAIVRLVTLTVINWSVAAFLDSKIPADQPIRHWMIACLLLFISNVIKLCFASSPKYHQKAEDVQSPRLNTKSTAVKVLVLPLFVVTLLTMFAGLHQMERLQYTTSQLMQQSVRFDTSIAPNELSKDASISVLVLILSSWTAQSFERRQILRETSLKLLKHGNKDVSITYRFVIGQPPSSRAKMSFGMKIQEESNQYHDLIMVPASDAPKHTSRKLLEAMRWLDSFAYDYLCKTSDDVFVRWDIVKSDVQAQGKSDNLWKGMVFRNMPTDGPNADKHSKYDYPLPVLPPYTTGTFYTLSKNVVNIIVDVESPRRFIASEERNVALWLFGYDVQPTHDRRIQDNGSCEDDLIAMRFTDKERSAMRKVYDDVVNGRSQCSSLKSSKCSLCYPCHGKADDWRSNNLHCDQFKGVTLRDQPEYLKVSGAKVKDDLEPSVIGVNDDWIIDGVLSKRSSKFSETDSWQLLYWVCWTSDPSTFTNRHWKALELVWVHEPRAVIFMISNTLPQGFFKEFTKQGYEIYVVHFNKENLLKWHWYFGPGTLDWLQDWDKWEKGNYFYWHLTDYIRCLLLYNYGGTYMDMDALWIRVPPDSNLEFIGSDYTGLISDREWTLDEDGLYLPQGLMRFKRGWSLFREMCEYAFSSYSYDPGCFNCHGPKAITTYVRNHRAALEMAGFTILPREILYPAGYTEIHKFLLSNPLAEQELKTKIMVTSWNIHLFGKMTNNLPIEDGSLVGHVLNKFDLDIPHRDVKTRNIISSTGSWDVPMKLVGPRNFIYRSTSPFTAISPDSTHNRRKALQQPTAGKFQGLDVLYVRGGPSKVRQAKIAVEVAFGKLKIGVPLSNELSATTVELTDATKKDVNVLLNSLVYSPSPLLAANGGRDRLKLSVSYDTGEKDEILVDIIVVETEEDELI